MFHKITPQNRASFLKALFAATIAQSLIFTACSQEDNAVVPPYTNTQNTTEVNSNNPINNPINIPPAEIYVNPAEPQTNIDPHSEVIKNENTENSTNIISTLEAEDIGTENVYGAFANHYSLMYEDAVFPDENGALITIQTPFPVIITNSCKEATLCNQRKIMVKTWISGFTDTATITGIVQSANSTILSPNLNFNDNALFSLTSAQKTQRQIEAYALEKDQKILFYSESKPITIHPMQVFGSLEPIFLMDSVSRTYQGYWYSVWVTPMADSISRIVNEVAQKLPNGKLLVYQKYAQDESVEQSTNRVAAAVFEVLQSRNIKYVKNTGAGSIGQRINYPVETLRKKQGLCIETAVLFASILERLGIYTYLIITQNHAFVGWFGNPNKDAICLIETTYISNKNKNAIDAMNKGIEEFNEEKASGNFETGNSMAIDINLARSLGITPNNIP